MAGEAVAGAPALGARADAGGEGAAPLTLRQLAGRAVPLMVAYLGQHLLGLVDTVLAGHVDARTLGAVGLGASLFIACAIVGMGLAMGVDPFISQAFGAGRPRLARQALWQGVWVALAASVPVAALLIVIARNLTALGVDPELGPGALAYAVGRAPALPFLFVFVTQRAYVQAAHHARAVLVSSAVANVVNLVAGAVLLYGDPWLEAHGLPALGVAPGDAGTLGRTAAGAMIVQVLVLSLAITRLPVGGGAEPVRRPVPYILRGVARLGIPLGLQMAAEVVCFASLTFLMGRMSTVAVAAHQTALMVASVTFSLTVGIGSATSVEVGRAIGRGDVAGTRRAGVLGVTLGVLVMGASALVLWFAPRLIALAISPDPEVVELAIVLLRVAGAFQLFDGAQAVASGALRGAGVTRWPLVANVVAYWGLGLPLGAWLTYGLGLGPAGLWWGITAALVFVSVALVAKFLAVARTRVASVHGDRR